MNHRIIFTVTDDALLMDSIGPDGVYLAQGAYQWGKYGADGMPDRAARAITEWLDSHGTPAWVRQWDDAAAQESHA